MARVCLPLQLLQELQQGPVGGPFQKSPDHLSLHKILRHLGSLSQSRGSLETSVICPRQRGKAPTSSQQALQPTESIPPRVRELTRSSWAKPGNDPSMDPSFSPPVVPSYSHAAWEPQPSRREWQHCPGHFRPGWASRPGHPRPGAAASQEVPAGKAGSEGAPSPAPSPSPSSSAPAPPRRRPPWARRALAPGGALPLPVPGGGARDAVTSRGARWQHLPAR